MHQISAEGLSSQRTGKPKMATTAGVMDNPLHVTGIALNSIKNEFRLSPRFNLYRKLIGVRVKTLIRILLSQWWNSRLEWFERQLLMQLLRCTKILPEAYILRGLDNGPLENQVEKYYYHERRQGWFPELSKLLYSAHQLKAVLGLRRIKTFFKYAYVKMPPEQSGKPRLKRARIRGYRDGKGKPMDQGLKFVIQANQFYYNLIDRIFHDEVDRMILDCSRRGP